MPRDTPYSGVAAMFRSSLERGEAPVVYEDGGQMRDFVHVDDVARANVAAALAVGARPAGSHSAYNVCSGHPIAIADVARAVAAGAAASGDAGPDAGLEPRVTGQFRVGDVRHVVASPRRAADDLGFVAQVHPGQGLARFATEALRP
jgi:dTDP-L-rhamnose 4-epimerase